MIVHYHPMIFDVSKSLILRKEILLDELTKTQNYFILFFDKNWNSHLIVSYVHKIGCQS